MNRNIAYLQSILLDNSLTIHRPGFLWRSFQRASTDSYVALEVF